MDQWNTSASPEAMKNGCTGPTWDFVPFTKEEVEQSIPERFEKIVWQYPDRIAVKIGSHVVTYAELDAMANRLARTLVKERGSKAEPIGLLFENGAPLMACMFAVWKAGKFVVLLDPSLPRARMTAILEDCQAKMLVADKQHVSPAGDIADASCDIIDFESIESNTSTENLLLSVPPTAPAFILYTSGSTGKPKGVPQSHRHRLYSVMEYTNAIRICPQDRLNLLSHGTGHATAISLRALLNGAALLPFNVRQEGVTRLAEWLVEEKISVCNMSSPLFRQLCEALTGKQEFPDLRLLRLSSEAVYKQDVELYKKYFPASCLFATGLASSEAGLLTLWMVNHDTEIPDSGVPVGYAVEDKEIFLMDDEGKEVGINQVGEIVVRSKYVSPEYWNRPDLSNAKFHPDPQDGEQRLYFTGDLALRLPDGCLIYKGRKDYRVKIRGYGVEIAEVEKCLRSHPAVKDAVIVSWPNELGELYLVAYFMAQNRLGPGVSELKGFLSETLPDYMVPSYFFTVDAIPLTPNGKLDRKALPLPGSSRPHLPIAYVAPQTTIEEKLVQIWEEVLGVHPIGTHDDFFDLGGHSLSGANLMARIGRAYDLDLPVRFLFESPTIAKLADHLTQNGQRGEEKGNHVYLVKLYSGSKPTAVFCFPYIGGFRNDFFTFARLARLMGLKHSFYGLQARGTDGVSQPHRCVEEMADDYTKDIQKLQPHGPYFLMAECGGGTVAYETARQLCERGEEVALLVILDDEGWRPWSKYLWRRLTNRLRYRMIDVRGSWAWNYLKERTAIHRRAIQQLKGGARLLYFFNKAGKATTIIQDLLYDTMNAPARPANKYEEETNTRRSLDLRRREKAYWLAAHSYRCRPYGGKITVLANEEWYDADPTLGWGKWVAGGVEIYRIPGNHDTYITENAHLVAAKLKECLEKAEREA